MCTEEDFNSKIKILLIMGDSEEEVNYPCASCRGYIKEFSTENTSILGGNFSLTKLKRWKIDDILPNPL
ncbi:MAG: hypothetical protein ACFFD2_28740, partial [Promethearchaeota archaeon]